MGSPYLKSTESIILSTNKVLVNGIPAEAILTNERLMLLDSRRSELSTQDIAFGAVETVTIDETTSGDPVLSLSLITAPGVTIPLEMVFPPVPKVQRVPERDEWAARLKELSVHAVRESGKATVEILPPWVPGPSEEPEGTGTGHPVPAESPFRNPPLIPRKQKKKPNNTPHIAAPAVIALIVVAAAAVYFFSPGLFAPGPSSPPVSPVPTTPATPGPTPSPTQGTTAPTILPTASETPVTTVTTQAQIIIPGTGVWVLVKYDGSYNGTVGAPGRFRTVSETGNHAFQIPAQNEIVTANIQKRDNTGRKLIVEIYDSGTLVKSGSVTAPSGTVSIGVDLRTV